MAEEPRGACPTSANPDLAAFCRSDMCGVIEVSNDSVSSCETDDECDLHLAKCCDCGTGAPQDYVALNVSKIGEYESQMCGPSGGGCPADCIGVHPDGLFAVCNPTTKHCQAVGGL